MNVSYTTLRWITAALAVLTVAAAVWAVAESARSQNPVVLVVVMPLLLLNLSAVSVLNRKKREDT